jgi:tetratricopeptide (TPR) repeat protein
MRFYLCLVLFLGAFFEADSCLLPEQLLKMQSEKLSSIHGFLSSEGWNSCSAMSDQQIAVFDYTLIYDKIVWNKYDQGIIELYYKHGKPSIVFYYPDSYCFESVLQQFASKQDGISSVSGNRLTTKFQKGNVTVQFEQGQYYANGRSYAIIVLQENEVKNEIAQEKEKIAKAERLRLEREVEAERVTQQAAVYFGLGQFELAEEEYRKLAGLEMVGADRPYDFGSTTWVPLKIRECQHGFCNRPIKLAEVAVNEKKYDEAISNYQVAIDCYGNAEFEGEGNIEIQRIQGKIRDIQATQKYDNGEQYFLEGNYDMALTSYEEAAVIANNRSESTAKLNDLRNRIKEAKSNEFFKTADNFFKDKQYRSAIEAYKEVLNLNPENKVAKDKIAAAENIIEILHKRRTITFKYSETNSFNYNAFKSQLLDLLVTTSESQPNGFIELETNLSFDTMGVNISAPIVNSPKGVGLEESLLEIHRSSKLSPPKLGDFFISSSDIERFQVDWKTEEIEFTTKRMNIVGPQLNGVSSVCTDYLKNKPYCYGTSVFSVRTKTLNGKQFIDIGLTKYNPKGMPSEALASLIVPGLGSLRVTHGQTGWFNMAGFFTLAGSAFVLNDLSEKRYASYQATTDQGEMDRLYNEANNMHKASLVCASLAATIYVSDIARAVSVGVKNKRRSSSLKSAVKKNSFDIQRQQLKY